jgi:hypothetical protein
MRGPNANLYSISVDEHGIACLTFLTTREELEKLGTIRLDDLGKYVLIKEDIERYRPKHH